jgi:hypothetical protein
MLQSPNQIAFSGKREFLERHADAKNQLIGVSVWDYIRALWFPQARSSMWADEARA